MNGKICGFSRSSFFHKKGRGGKRQLPRRFLRKRGGAVSVLALSVSSLRSLPPLPKGEARALPETFSLHLKLQQQAFDLGSPFGRAGAGAPERVRSPGGSCRAATEGL